MNVFKLGDEVKVVNQGLWATVWSDGSVCKVVGFESPYVKINHPKVGEGGFRPENLEYATPPPEEDTTPKHVMIYVENLTINLAP
jgi:hypothetical protein